MKETQRIILIIGATLTFLELTCPPSNMGRLIFGFSPNKDLVPLVDIPEMLRHLAIILTATFIAYQTNISAILAKQWQEFLGNTPEEINKPHNQTPNP